MNNVYSKISPELLKVVSLSNDISTDCIIYSSNFDNLKSEITKLKRVFYEYPFISAFGIKLTQSQILKCANIYSVKYISKQTKVSAQIDLTKKILNLEKIYKDNVFDKKVNVAVIDTGISYHLDFMIPRKKIIRFVDLIKDKKEAYDDNGHGTFVSSMICGNGFVSNNRYSGIAKNANIISIKALEESGETGAFKILEAMQWIYDNKEKYDIKVVCMSFGSSPIGEEDPLVLGAEALWNIGIVVVAAAGNSGPENYTIKSPGFSKKIITVGGLNDQRVDNQYDVNKFEIAEFSSRGPAGRFYKPDCIVPAVNIIGASNSDNFYSKMSGTSVAAPIVAGLCCLIISKYPFYTPDQVKMLLIRNSRHISYDRNSEGFGLIDMSRIF